MPWAARPAPTPSSSRCGPWTRPGDEVITTPFTFFATAEAIQLVGATPVFVDIDPDSFNLDPPAETAVTPRTRRSCRCTSSARCADMDPLLGGRPKQGITVVEDAAQAIGGDYRPQGAGGTLGDIGCFTFFPTQEPGRLRRRRHGDHERRRARRAACACLRVHGAKQKYYHEVVGYNSRLDALQAAVLRVKLPHLDGWSAARRRHAAFYDQALAAIDGLATPVVRPGNESIVNQYTLRIAGGKRDALREHLTARGVGCSVYYPVPLHLQQCFAYLGYREGQFPESERACREVLSIPVYPELTEAQTGYVAETIRGFFGA